MYTTMYTDLLVIFVLLFSGLGVLLNQVFIAASAGDARDGHEPIYPEGSVDV